MEYIPLILASLGVVLIIVGVFVSIVDWNRQHRMKSNSIVTEETSLDKSITALAKLAEALKNLTLGMQLILVGIALEIIASFFGGIVLVSK